MFTSCTALVCTHTMHAFILKISLVFWSSVPIKKICIIQGIKTRDMVDLSCAYYPQVRSHVWFFYSLDLKCISHTTPQLYLCRKWLDHGSHTSQWANPMSSWLSVLLESKTWWEMGPWRCVLWSFPSLSVLCFLAAVSWEVFLLQYLPPYSF